MIRGRPFTVTTPAQIRRISAQGDFIGNPRVRHRSFRGGVILGDAYFNPSSATR